MREENFAAAAQAQREVALLTERLPANKALLNALLQRLDAATHAACAGPEEEEAARAEKLAVLERLGELADWDGAAAVAAALHDGDAAVAAAAEEALWGLFMTCPTPELQTQMRQGVSLMRRPEQWDQVGRAWGGGGEGGGVTVTLAVGRQAGASRQPAGPAGSSPARPSGTTPLLPLPGPPPPRRRWSCLTPWCARRPPLPRRTTSAAQCCTSCNGTARPSPMRASRWR